ncbi:MAG: Rieske 2Fe-2S domain-containing protein [Streptosporangiales bacterium]|nr:Rieske 2Fe-2S domain-containing protein [Streptosporangiales bacterium]
MTDHDTAEFVEVDASDLADGQMKRVDVAGSRVLLAFVDGQYHAIDAVCTHEHAYLDEGALMGNVVYCPLHYSAFDVTSGDVLGPPADRSTQCYPVQVVDGKVLVGTTPGRSATTAAEPPEDEGTVHPARPHRNLHSRLIDPIDSFGWLERLARSLQRVVTPVRAKLAGLFDLLHGKPLGHALHPALSDLPIGLWAGSLLLYAFGYGEPGVLLSILGSASAVAAAATGTADWSVSDGHERRVGLLHGLLMTGALLVQIGSSVAYFAGLGALTIVLSVVSIATTLGAAYLGGHLVLGRGAMVDHTNWTPASDGWTRTVQDSELAPGASLPTEAGDLSVLLHRGADDRISAIVATCSHAGAPLSLGKVCEGIVSCPWHYSRFRLTDGAVVRGPATFPQPPLDVRVRDGWIEVRAAQATEHTSR